MEVKAIAAGADGVGVGVGVGAGVGAGVGPGVGVGMGMMFPGGWARIGSAHPTAIAANNSSANAQPSRLYCIPHVDSNDRFSIDGEHAALMVVVVCLSFMSDSSFRSFSLLKLQSALPYAGVHCRLLEFSHCPGVS
jgi:hypothetical protein